MNTLKQTENLLTISLVVNNGEKYLGHCLDSLASQTFTNFLLLIIDNASIDNTKKFLESWLNENPAMAKKTRVITNKKNLGFCKGHNQAWQWSSGEYFCILNQDVILRPNYFELILEVMVKNNAAAAQGKLLSWNFSPNQNYPKDLSKPLNKEEAIDSCGLVVYKNRHMTNLGQGEVDAGQFNNIQEIFGVGGTAPIYTRLVLEKVVYGNELFDENFFAYKEDVDLAWRLRKLGLKSYLVPAAVGYHDRSLKEDNSLLKIIKKRRRWSPQLRLSSYRNHWLVLLKNDTFKNFIKDLPAIAWYEFKKICYMIVFEPIVFMRSWGQIAKLFSKTRKKRLKGQEVLSNKEMRTWFV